MPRCRWGGRIDFFRQGATASETKTIPAGGAQTATLNVYDVGELVVNNKVQVGLGGRTLIVNKVNSPTQVELKNLTGTDVAVSSGTRLIVLSSRPVLYADPFGTVSLGSTLTADATGRVTAYVDQRRYDYVSAAPVSVDAASSANNTGTISTLSWSHTASGIDRLVIVGVSWREETGEDALTGVTYDGTPMTYLAGGTGVDLYYLVNPPTGTKTVQVTWSGSGRKGAVGGALSFTNADQSNPFGPASVASGSGTAATAKAFGTFNASILLDVLQVDADSGFVTIDPGAPQTERWDRQAGDAVLTYVQGGGSTRGGSSDDSNDVSLNWTLGAARPWNLIAASIRPLGARLVIDVEGSVFTATPFGVNVRDFQSVKDAIDSLPLQGGLVYFPKGGYSPTSVPRFDPGLELPTDRPVHLLGEGNGTLLSAPPNTPTSTTAMIHLQGDNQIIEGIRFSAQLSHPDLKGVRLYKPTGTLFRSAVKNCWFAFIPSHSVYVATTTDRFSILLTFDDLNLEDSGGIYVGEHGTASIYLNRCRVTRCSNLCAEVGPSGAISFVDCIFEFPLNASLPFMDLTGTNNVLLDHCYFEGGLGTAPFVYAHGQTRGLTLDSCRFRRVGSYRTALQVNDPAQPLDVARGVTVINPLMSGLPTPPLADHFIFSGECEQVLVVGGGVEEGGPILTNARRVWRPGKPVDIASQTASIPSTNFVVAPGPGLYSVAVYVKTVTVGNPLDRLDVSIGWNDGSVQTQVVIGSHDLSVANRQSNGEVRLYLAADQNISYQTAVTATGTPAYMLRIRADSL